MTLKINLKKPGNLKSYLTGSKDSDRIYNSVVFIILKEKDIQVMSRMILLINLIII